LHAFHASEIPFVFGTADRTPAFWPKVSEEPADVKLAEAMSAYWAAFARNGTPDAPGLPRWQPYGADRAYMLFADGPQPAAHLLPGMFELNEQVVCRRRAKGGVPWNWNVGIVSPPLPEPVQACK